MNKRKDTFKDYRERRVEARLEVVKAALRSLANSNHNNITRLAKDVASYVTAFELAENSVLDESRQEDLKPVSHVTILRNEAYRTLLDEFLGKANAHSDQKALMSFENEDLRLKNVALEAKVRQLKNLLVDNLSGSEVYIDGQSAEPKLYEMLDFMLCLVDRMQRSAPGCYKNVLEGEIGGRHSPGFHGPNGMVATIEEMRNFELIQIAVRDWKKRSKSL
ncbi:hypothetical protein [Pseudomonas sp. BEA3.1]|uniref:hypothetical protein n=1 Tax=Pseudomonas sp. BEA3.1 TaxID=3083251 RepID=UPI002964F258|nr:hypothetical protein [Pseudomonas sp. BEA3.1]MDW2777955.1 hypothetical protein [Pseudomonas sp. BEA3.1]